MNLNIKIEINSVFLNIVTVRLVNIFFKTLYFLILLDLTND